MSGPYGQIPGQPGGPGEPGEPGGPGGGGADDDGPNGGAGPARIPPPRSPADDSMLPPATPVAPVASDPSHPSHPSHPSGQSGRPDPSAPSDPSSAPGQPPYDHRVLKSLLGAWALSACSAEETNAVEGHLSDCGTCAEEALRLRDAVGLLHPEDSLDLDPMLRSRVLEGCMVRRAPRVPVPDWAAPYDAETSRLDALLRDMADAEWLTPVSLRWFDGRQQTNRETTVAGVISHLLAVDGLVATALGLPDPLSTVTASAPGAEAGAGGSAGGSAAAGAGTEAGSGWYGQSEQAGRPAHNRRDSPTARTEMFWLSDCDVLRTPSARAPWREQGHDMVSTVSFASPGVAELGVSYGGFNLPVRDALLERAFECWVHAEDIAAAIDYPYDTPQGTHMHHMVDLAARMLPDTIAWRRRKGLASPPQRLAAAGAPGRALHLEVEGEGGGDWYIPLDSPGASARPADAVAHVALDGYEFCQLAAGHVPPLEAAAGQDGDREAIRDVLFAAASLSRM